MESAQIKGVKIRKFTAAWDITEWEVRDGIVYLNFNGIKVGFDLSAVAVHDYKTDKPITIVLEIPYALSIQPPV